jgi:glycerol-3-phosphate dehydrogenase subunit B
MKSKEIVVIGSGIAGITALIKLKELGYSPILITKGAGSSMMFSGSYDIASIIESKFLKDIDIPIMEQIKLIKNRNKNHPYNYINDIESTINNSFKLINKKLKLNLVDIDLSKPNYLIPTQTGYLKESSLITNDSLGLDLKSMMESGENYGILNFTLFNDFFYEKLLYNLNSIKNEKKSKSNFYIINFDFLRRSSDVNLKNYDLARIIESNDLYIELIKKILEITKQENITNIISPAIWGIDKFEDINTFLTKKINIIETLSNTPSTFGIRLQKKINKYLKDNNITVLNEKVVDFKSENGRVLSIKTNKNTEIDISGIILASGKFIGGGINTDNGYSESIFNIPLFYNGKPLSQSVKEPMFENDYFKKHGAFSIGVKINNRFQALNIDENIFFNNVFVAGNIIADYNYIAREGGFGVAISTGYKAAKSLSHII